MSALRELQENFQKYILENDQQVFNQIVGIDRMSAPERAQLYKTDYTLRLVEVSEKDFPCLKKYMGDEAFDQMARAYVLAYPSNHFNILYYDRFFTKFLATYEQADPIHIDLAKFEWEIGTTLIAADAQQLIIDDLAAISPDEWAEMKLVFHPSAHLFELHSNAPDIWKALDHDEETVPTPEYFEQPVTWMMWRFNQLSYFISLNETREWMYHAINEGKNFGEICEGLTEFMEEEAVAEFACLSLRDWFLEGAISQIIL